MKVYQTRENCQRGCRLQRYDKDSHIEIRVNTTTKNIIRPPTLILCKKHLINIFEDANHKMLGYKLNCALCGNILDKYGRSVSLDLDRVVAPAYDNEPVDFILFNFKAMSLYIAHNGCDLKASELLINCASFLESTPYESEAYSLTPFANTFDNIGNTSYYPDAVEWFIDSIASVNYSGIDKMTIYGITYADLKLLVFDYINDQSLGDTHINNSSVSNAPYWNNILTSNFVVHESCANHLIGIDWSTL